MLMLKALIYVKSNILNIIFAEYEAQYMIHNYLKPI